ncbi:kinase-like domain-containing protein [Ampelomyces quisqualis]|uniref:Kinase-like domain-containing protein n=1 Tax=Ampelomyces quisqualis TaxID=50730 RepID=A0A6A5QVS3_AMPQU|nr:kinase-like domain-containing protein [Ampelomyces quisqualis]
MTLRRGVFIDITKLYHRRLLHMSRGSQSMPFQPLSDVHPLFSYTSGRWLWNEREQLEARCRRFDVASLQQAACQAVGAKKCVSLQKIGEGNYNKAYRLEMEDGQKVIAKIPHPNAGPQALTTASEVATMEFARTILDIPVPKVRAWSATDRNPVQAEYIIMEEAKGSQLHEVWDDLSLRTKCNIVREIVDIEKRLLSVSFDKLGSLYFQDSGITGCEPAIVTNGRQDVISRIKSRYCIGPITRREFWERQRSDMQYHGPWRSSTEYLDSVTRREMQWINQTPQQTNQIKYGYPYLICLFGILELYIWLFDKYLVRKYIATTIATVLYYAKATSTLRLPTKELSSYSNLASILGRCYKDPKKLVSLR